MAVSVRGSADGAGQRRSFLTTSLDGELASMIAAAAASRRINPRLGMALDVINACRYFFGYDQEFSRQASGTDLPTGTR